MKFRTSFDCSCSSPECCSGTRLRQLYKRVIDEKSGKPVIVPDRKEDTYQGIQISAKGRQVSELVARALRGDDNAVRPSVDSFVDLTNAPKDAMEAQNMIIRSREAFYSLPLDIRKDYSNNPAEWLSALSDGSFKTYLSSKNKSVADRKRADEFFKKSQSPFTPEQEKHLKSLIGGSSNE